MDTNVDITGPVLFKRLVDLQARNLAIEQGMFQQLDAKVDRYEQEIRKLRQKNYGQQIELRAKDSQLKEMTSQMEEEAATIVGLRQQLVEAAAKINAFGAQEKVYQQRIAAAEERYLELQGICEMTASTLRRSAGSSANSSGFVNGMNSSGGDGGDENGADKWDQLNPRYLQWNIKIIDRFNLWLFTLKVLYEYNFSKNKFHSKEIFCVRVAYWVPFFLMYFANSFQVIFILRKQKFILTSCAAISSHKIGSLKKKLNKRGGERERGKTSM